MTAPGITFDGNFKVISNTTKGTVSIDYKDSNNVSQSLSLEAGPYLRVDGVGVTLNVLDQSLTGNFLIESTVDSVTGSSVVVILASRVEVLMKASEANVVSVTNGEGALVLNSEGIAGQLSGAIDVNIGGGATFKAANLLIQLNNTNSQVVQEFEMGGKKYSMDIPFGPYLRLSTQSAELTITGQTIKGNANFEQVSSNSGSQSKVLMSFEDVGMNLGQG